MNGVFIKEWEFGQVDIGQLNSIRNEVFFAGDGIDGNAFVLPGQGGNGKAAQKQEKKASSHNSWCLTLSETANPAQRSLKKQLNEGLVR